jgi:hypothetical protein
MPDRPVPGSRFPRAVKEPGTAASITADRRRRDVPWPLSRLARKARYDIHSEHRDLVASNLRLCNSVVKLVRAAVSQCC